MHCETHLAASRSQTENALRDPPGGEPQPAGLDPLAPLRSAPAARLCGWPAGVHTLRWPGWRQRPHPCQAERLQEQWRKWVCVRAHQMLAGALHSSTQPPTAHLVRTSLLAPLASSMRSCRAAPKSAARWQAE